MKRNDLEYIQQAADAYLACALWSSVDMYGTPLDQAWSDESWSDDARQHALATCAYFLGENRALIGENDIASGDLGHDLWLTRNHHGAGFWDRKHISEKAREVLTLRAQELGECYAFVNSANPGGEFTLDIE